MQGREHTQPSAHVANVPKIPAGSQVTMCVCVLGLEDLGSPDLEWSHVITNSPDFTKQLRGPEINLQRSWELHLDILDARDSSSIDKTPSSPSSHDHLSSVYWRQATS